LVAGSHALNIGRRSGGGLEFNGTIDEVGVWDRAIDDWEVSWLYKYRYGLERTSYDPLGNILIGGDNTRFNYEGKENDKMTGQVDFHSRQYNTRRGQYTTPDPELPQIFDPQQLNHYMFERGNSYKYIDANGHRVTYAVEDAGSDKIIAVYRNGEYVGRVIDEVKETINIKTGSGTEVPITTYDYVVQPGSKANAGSGTFTASSYDNTLAPTQMLSEICETDPHTEEYTQIGVAAGEDTIGALSFGGSSLAGGVIKNVPKAIDVTSRVLDVKTTIGVTTASGGIWGKASKALELFPGVSTYRAIKDKSGYSAYSRIPQYSSIKQTSKTKNTFQFSYSDNKKK